MAEDFTLDDILDDELIVDLNTDEYEWLRLMEEIERENVIPVIGNDMLCDSNANETLLKICKANLNARQSKASSFSELIFDKNVIELLKGNPLRIYGIAKQIYDRKQSQFFSPSEVLKKIVRMPQFKFVITTSFLPVVETAMREVWGDKLRVINFNNNKSEVTRIENDVISDEDMHKPTLLYMFGKVGSIEHTFALTDNDMLAFCSSWLNDGTRPKMLTSKLKDKYLLMLGNSHSDWLFRFIWFSVRNSGGGNSRGGTSTLYANENTDDALANFLSRNHTFINNKPREVVDQITRRLEERKNRHQNAASHEGLKDFFISYSRADKDFAVALVNSLTDKGVKVWFDFNDIYHGDPWQEAIRKGIANAKYFVPILSHNIEREKNYDHEYRNEWRMAIERANRLGRKFIIPVAEQGFDFYNAQIDQKIQEHNAITYSSATDASSVAAKLINAMDNDLRI